MTLCCTKPNAAYSRHATVWLPISFMEEDVFQPVHILSGGEKTRLKLCIFMNTQVNTLFLDEPHKPS